MRRSKGEKKEKKELRLTKGKSVKRKDEKRARRYP